MVRTFGLAFWLLLPIFLWSQIPSGYYNPAQGLTGTALQSALHGIIDNHTSVSYSALWNHFQNTDKKTNNKVWDIYSDIPGGTPPYEFTFVTNQCGNYNSEADCYNREHSFPSSWFNDGTPMYTDLFHLYPTDGYVNNMRGNYPFGEVASPTWTSLNGSKRGTCSWPGYTGIVFEPIDAYKGDLARSYFYMATRYYGEDSGWPGSDMVLGSQPKAWALSMLLDWHQSDPVSQKEIDRNNTVYGIQNNRNPFIDHPEYAYLIWNPSALSPVFTSFPEDTVFTGTAYTYAVQVTNPGSQAVSFTATGLPTWLSLSSTGSNSALLSGTPTAGQAGSYSITIQANNGQSTPGTQSFTLHVLLATQVPEDPQKSLAGLFPNPADQWFFLSMSDSGTLGVFDPTGRCLGIKKVEPGDNRMEVSSLPSGLYFIQVISRDTRRLFPLAIQHP